mmetsp:Transcript_21186/g.68367  ORF Transcript_21186/g.68367 Transcript_21186/m.68367 type:complete len:208 (-) Transcript_21186:1131-1754(-)
MGACRPPSSADTCSFSWTSSRARQISSSVCLSNGSKLFRSVPANSTGSCGITDSRERSWCRPNPCTGTPSIRISPASQSTSRNRHAVASVLLPLPVRPTIATFSPARMSNVSPSSTGSRSGRYRSRTFRNSIAPCAGHSLGGAGSRSHAPSLGSPVYSFTRSTLTSNDSTSADWRTHHWNRPVSIMVYDSDSPTVPASMVSRAMSAR